MNNSFSVKRELFFSVSSEIVILELALSEYYPKKGLFDNSVSLFSSDNFYLFISEISYSKLDAFLKANS